MDKYNIQYSKESVDDLRNIYAYICVNATPFCLNTATLDCQ